MLAHWSRNSAALRISALSTLRGEIVPPAAAIDEFDEMGLPTLRQGEPFARDTVVRTFCRSDMEKPEAPVESVLLHLHGRV